METTRNTMTSTSQSLAFALPKLFPAPAAHPPELFYHRPQGGSTAIRPARSLYDENRFLERIRGRSPEFVRRIRSSRSSRDSAKASSKGARPGAVAPCRHRRPCPRPTHSLVVGVGSIRYEQLVPEFLPPHRGHRRVLPELRPLQFGSPGGTHRGNAIVLLAGSQPDRTAVRCLAGAGRSRISFDVPHPSLRSGFREPGVLPPTRANSHPVAQCRAPGTGARKYPLAGASADCFASRYARKIHGAQRMDGLPFSRDQFLGRLLGGPVQRCLCFRWIGYLGARSRLVPARGRRRAAHCPPHPCHAIRQEFIIVDRNR
jgi:hypothetical protein